MVSFSNGEYYYNFSKTSLLGRYDVRGISDGCEKTFATYFIITPDGKESTLQLNILYIFVSFSLFALAILFLYLATLKREDEGLKVSFFFLALASVFILSHMIFTSSIIQKVIGEDIGYSVAFWVYCIVLMLIFVWVMIKITKEVFDTLMKQRGLQ